VLAADAQPHVVHRGGEGGRARPREDDPHLLDGLADEVEGVEERRAADDRRAVLVVVEDGHLHRLPQRLLDVEAVRGADVLEVDPAHRRLEQLAEAHHVVGILAADLQVEAVEIGELLEQVRLALHHRLAGQRADVAEAEHGRAVRDHGDQVPLGRVPVGVLGPLADLQAGLGHPGRVGEGEVPLVGERLGRDDRDLPGSAAGVVVEGIFALHGAQGSGAPTPPEPAPGVLARAAR
jgi:hypothetical protein